MKRLGLVSLLLGFTILAVWGFFYFFSGEKVFQSDQIALKEPVVNYTQPLELNKEGLPYKINMDITFKVNGSPSNGKYSLFNYSAVVANSDGKVVSQVSRSFEHEVDSTDEDESLTGNKFNNVNLATIKDIDEGTYALALTITRNNNLPKEIELGNLTIEVKEKVVLVTWILPVVGLIIMLLGAYIFTLTKKKSITPDNGTSEKK